MTPDCGDDGVHQPWCRHAGERAPAPRDRFADGMAQACRLLRAQALLRAGQEGVVIREFLDEASCEPEFALFPEAAEELRRG